MRWNLRLVAASRGVWRAKDLQSLLAGHGLVMSAGKTSSLWSGTPASVKLKDLEVICRALRCDIDELLTPDEPRQPAVVVVPEPRRNEKLPYGRDSRAQADRHRGITRQRAAPDLLTARQKDI